MMFAKVSLMSLCATICFVVTAYGDSEYRLSGNTYTKNDLAGYDKIVVPDGTRAQIQTTEQIDNLINVQDNGDLIQLVTAPDEIKKITNINVSSGGTFGVCINGQKINLAGVANLFPETDSNKGKAELYLADSSKLLLDANFDGLKFEDVFVILGGGSPVTIEIQDNYVITDAPILYNVARSDSNAIRDGDIVFVPTTTNSLYYLSAGYDISNRTVSIVHKRATDYTEIFDDAPVGVFLDSLRETNPNDSLLHELDKAPDMAALRDVMNGSVRLKPMLLMDSVRTLDLLEINDINNVKRRNVRLTPFYVFGSEMNSVGARLSLTTNVDDVLYVTLSGYAHKMSYDSGVNNYDAGVYGGNLRVDYLADDVFVRSVVGASFAAFDIGPVFDGNGTVNSPSGLSLYGYVDAGYHFDLDDGFYINPFVGVGADYTSVLGTNENKMFARGGTDIGFESKIGEIIYRYNGRVGVNTFGYFDAMLSADFWFDDDNAGIGLNVGASGSDVGFVGKASIDLSVKF